MSFTLRKPANFHELGLCSKLALPEVRMGQENWNLKQTAKNHDFFGAGTWANQMGSNFGNRLPWSAASIAEVWAELVNSNARCEKITNLGVCTVGQNGWKSPITRKILKKLKFQILATFMLKPLLDGLRYDLWAFISVSNQNGNLNNQKMEVR